MSFPSELLIVGGLVLLTLSQVVDRRVLLCGMLLAGYYVYDYQSINRHARALFKRVSDTTEPKDKVVIETNGYRRKMDLNPHTTDETIVKFMRDLRKFRRYNKPSYDKGRQFLIQFMKDVHQLESGVTHPRQIYENAETNYKGALREFQGLSMAGPSMSYGQVLTRKRHGTDTNYRGVSTSVGELCKSLHDYCYYRLYNLAMTMNQDWSAKPDMYKSEIVLSDIREANAYDPALVH